MARDIATKRRAAEGAEARKRKLLAEKVKARANEEAPSKDPFEDSVAALSHLPKIVSMQSDMATKVQAVRLFLEGWQAEVHGRWPEVAAVLAVRNGLNFTVGREHTLLMRIALGVPDNDSRIDDGREAEKEARSLAALASELAQAYQNTLGIETALVAQTICGGGGLKPFNARRRSSAHKKRPPKKGGSLVS